MNAQIKGRIYLSGTFVFDGVQNHYGGGGQPQNASVTIRISSDRSDGGIACAKIRFENQRFQLLNGFYQEVVRPPEITHEGDKMILIVPQPSASLAIWLHLLTKAPGRSYYINYGFEEKRSWAFVTAVADTQHPIGI